MTDEQTEALARFFLGVFTAAKAALDVLGIEIIDDPHSARNTGCVHANKDDQGTFGYDRWVCLDCGYTYDSREDPEEDS